MKIKQIELDVDYIGDQEPLTTEEAKALSDFFKQRKSTVNKATTKHSRPTKSTVRPSSGQ